SLLRRLKNRFRSCPHRSLVALHLCCGESPRRYGACPRPPNGKQPALSTSVWTRTAGSFCMPPLHGWLLGPCHSVASPRMGRSTKAQVAKI
ncbi:hypothetical protein FB45DRAFT_734938, partial [Roridomyces roridus]